MSRDLALPGGPSTTVPRTSTAFSGRERLILAIVCAAVLVINLSTTIVNITLPRLTEDLGASTRDLLWIVDAFNLAFAAFVLAGGTLSDRFGRRRLLVIGLALFGVASFGGATAGSPGQLIAWRAAAGVGAAVIFPVTLSVISDVFTDRARRAKAIGLWGASTGLAIALGPIVGGFLVQYVSWNSTLLFPAVVAVLPLIGAVLRIPESRDPATPPLDHGGLVLSTIGLALLVYAIIEAPERGWLSIPTLGVLAGALVALLAFTLWERGQESPTATSSRAPAAPSGPRSRPRIDRRRRPHLTAARQGRQPHRGRRPRERSPGGLPRRLASRLPGRRRRLRRRRRPRPLLAPSPPDQHGRREPRARCGSGRSPRDFGPVRAIP